MNKKIYIPIGEWRNRKLKCKYPYVYLDGIYLKRNCGGKFENIAVLLAIGLNEDGYRKTIGAAEIMKEETGSWKSFLIWLKDRGLDGTEFFIGDRCWGMLEAINECFWYNDKRAFRNLKKPCIKWKNSIASTPKINYPLSC